MPRKYILAPLAKSDLHSIRQFIARDNPHAAKKVIEDIFKSIQNLAENPNIGHTCEDLTDKPVRFFSVRNFMIVYRADTSPLRIARVLAPLARWQYHPA